MELENDMKEIHICAYGCGKVGKFQMINGKWCCSKSFISCEAIRFKLKETMNNAIEVENLDHKLCDYGCGKVAKYKIGNKLCCSRSYNSCPGKKLSKFIPREKPEVCDYGCGQEPKFYFRASNKWCCSDHFRKCPSERIKNGLRKLGFKNTKETLKLMSLVKLGKSNKTTVVAVIPNKDILCSYGCGKIARYKFGNNNYCCESFHTKCERVIEIRNETFYERMKEPEFREMLSFSQQGKTCSKGIKIEEDENIKCDYGCKNVAKYFFPTVNKYCCSDSFEKCEESKRLQSLNMIEQWLDPNSSHRSLSRKQKRSDFMKNGGSVYSSSFIKNPSKPQVELYNRIKEEYPNAVLNYPLYREIGQRDYSLDVAIPELMICFESEGSYWHQNKEDDDKRQKEIEESGWRVIRYFPVDTIKQVPSIDQIKKDIETIIENKK